MAKKTVKGGKSVMPPRKAMRMGVNPMAAQAALMGSAPVGMKSGGVPKGSSLTRKGMKYKVV